MNKSKLICIFSQSLMLGGSEKQSVLLAIELNKFFRINFIIFYPEKIKNSLLDQLIDSNIEILLLEGNRLHKILKLFKFFKNSKPYIIFNFLLLPNFIGGIIGRLSGIKYSIGGIRSALIEKNKIFINKVLQNYINDLTIYNNSKGLEFTARYGFNNKKAIVIPNCIEMINKPIIRKNENIIKILSVGRFSKTKDYYTALKTITEIKKNELDFEYTIVGWGELEDSINKWILKFGLEDCVKVIIDPPNIEDYYIQADIFIQTSLYEGTSNTIMEAMNYYLPIIATNVGDNDKLVIHNKNGYLTSAKDIAELSYYSLKLIQNYRLRIKFGNYSHNRLKLNYSTNIFRQKYIDLINSLN